MAPVLTQALLARASPLVTSSPQHLWPCQPWHCSILGVILRSLSQSVPPTGLAPPRGTLHLSSRSAFSPPTRCVPLTTPGPAPVHSCTAATEAARSTLPAILIALGSGVSWLTGIVPVRVLVSRGSLHPSWGPTAGWSGFRVLPGLTSSSPGLLWSPAFPASQCCNLLAESPSGP